MVKSFRKNIKKSIKKSKKFNKQNIKQKGGSNEPTGVVLSNGSQLGENTNTDGENSPGSAKELLEICREACDIMQPMIEAFYNKINNKTGSVDSEKTKKEDKSDFTVVDALVQYYFQYVLFNGKFKAVIGEEDLGVNGKNVKIDNDDGNYYIINRISETETEDLSISPQFNDFFDKANNKNIKNKLLKLKEKFKTQMYKDKYVVIDPIDGTTEFTTKHGQQSTICVGFSNVEDGMAWAGIVYRPIPPSSDEPYDYKYIYGCKTEGLCICKKYNTNDTFGELDYNKEKPTITPNTLLTSNKDLSEYINSVLNINRENKPIDPNRQQLTRVNSGGAGNKMLKVLEGVGEAYIQDRGLSRWDTCAAQAIIEAAGGICCKLNNFIGDAKNENENKNENKNEKKNIVRYIYKISDVNENFNENAKYKPIFTLYNINDEYKDDLIEFIKNGFELNKDVVQMKKNNNITYSVINKFFKVRKEVERLDAKINTKKLNKYKKKTKLLAKNQIITEDELNKKLYKEYTDNHYDIKYYKPYSNLGGIVAFLDPAKQDYYYNICIAAAIPNALPEYS